VGRCRRPAIARADAAAASKSASASADGISICGGMRSMFMGRYLSHNALQVFSRKRILRGKIEINREKFERQNLSRIV
jgi:hypothetical protein